MRKPILLLLTLFVALPLAAQSRRRATTQPVPFPGCTIVNGTPGVTFTRDEGRTLAPVAQTLTGIGYTYGLAALDTPGTLLSWHKATLSISHDNGCGWQPLGDFTFDYPPSITAAKGGRAFAWSDNRQFLLRYDSRGVMALKPPAVFVGLGTDRSNGDRLRAGSDEGALWESTDGGDSWNLLNRLPPLDNSFVYRFAFDPASLDHILAGRLAGGAYVTFDGGRNWQRTSFGDNYNVMNLVVSPVNPNVVWAMAVESSTGVHAIHNSNDGGRTFRQVVASSAEVTIVNQPVMAAHPTDSNVLYFVFGTYFQQYGTDLYRVDANGGVTLTHNGNDGVNSIAFSPDDPSVMYLGLESHKGGGL